VVTVSDGGGGGSRLRTVVLLLLPCRMMARVSLKREKVLHFHAVAFPFSSPLCLPQLPPVSLFFFYYLLVAVAATGTADDGWETK